MMLKKVYTITLTSIIATTSLYSMDMDKVNRLAEMFKTGKSSTSIASPAPHVDTQNRETANKEQQSSSTATEEKSTTETEIVKPTISEESLGLRKVDLYSEDSAKPEVTQYGKDAAGSSKRFERAYENAPPMIPHDVEGLLPIKIGNNACLGCHMPDVAPSMKATPIPPSHFTNYRPTTEYKDGELVKEGKTVSPKGNIGNTSDIKLAKAKKLDHLYQGRFNCSQCHAPQSTQAPLVGNTFKPDFVTKDGNKKSNLIDVINEGVE